MKDFDYDELRTFVLYVDTQSTVQTARALGVTQPTVSYTLKKLERRFQVPVFGVAGKRKVLAPFGEALYRHAKAELQRFELHYRDFLRVHASAQSVTLRIAGRLDLFFFFLQQLGFDGNIQLQPCTSHEAVERLLTGKTDVAFSNIKPNRLDLVAHKLYACRFAWCVHQRSGLRSLSDLSAERLGHRRLAVFSAPDEVWFDACGLGPEVVRALAPVRRIYCENWVLLESIIAADQAIGINWVESSLGRNTFNRDLHFFEECVSAPMQFHMLYPRSLMQSPPFRSAVAGIRDAFEKLRRA
jgi:DNA-binding transcriptional LysR family regulator